MEKEELIQAYVHGTLNDTETAAFEKELSTNLDLRNAVLDYKNIHESIKLAERENLKKRLQQLNLEEEIVKPQKKTIVRRLRPYLLPLAAASVIGIIFLVNDGFSSNNTDLYNDYYTSYPNTLQPITRSTADTNIETKAFVAYESGDYKKATVLFKEILANKIDPDIKFYYSMSLINSGNEKKALPLLNQLKKDSTLYVPQTYWYAALLELKKGNNQRSKELIDSLQLFNADFKTKEILELKKQLK